MKQRKRSKTTGKGKTAFDEPSPSRQSECGRYVLNSTEHDSSHRVKSELSGEENKKFPLLHFTNLMTGFKWTVYSNGDEVIIEKKD